MTSDWTRSAGTLSHDLTAGLVVFLIALPLCMGIALASNAPLLSGVVAGVVGGIVVGWLSHSQTSVSGPDAGLAAIVATQIAMLGFPAFLMAVVIAGLIQSALGIARAGFVAKFIPSSVIQGFLSAIGMLLIFKQIPHLLGHDADPQGDMAFQQPDDANTFTELARMFGHIHPGALAIGMASLALLVLWAHYKPLKESKIPAPLIVVLLGVILSLLFGKVGGKWVVEADNYVRVPVADDLTGFLTFLNWPDFSQWRNPAVYLAGLTIAAVASLETLLNLEAVDKIDPQQRTSPPSRELLAQGIGNVVSGLLGGIPITSVIIRSSVNINAGNQTKLATIAHGALLLVSVVFLPQWLNMIPLSCLAAILLVTGAKLVSPALIRGMWQDGYYQFIPFAVTVIAIIFTDLTIGIVIGLFVSVSFILNSNFRRPIRRYVEKHLGGDVLHIELANQVSFLNRAALHRVLNDIPAGGSVLIDAQNTDYIDPDVLNLLREFTEKTAPTRQVQVSLMKFRQKYQFSDQIQYVDYSTRELQSQLTPQQVLNIMKEGYERFRSGQRLTRDLGRQVSATASGQHPLAVVLSCIDSRVPAELIFDVGLGDIFSVRIAGNVTSREVLGSLEYACAAAGAKLILVMGHTRCGAVAAAVELASSPTCQIASWEHLKPIVKFIQQSIKSSESGREAEWQSSTRSVNQDNVAHHNVEHVTESIIEQSQIIRDLQFEGKVAVVGAIYDVVTGELKFINHKIAAET